MSEQPRWESGNPGNWVSISRGDEGIGTERLAVDRLKTLEARAQHADALAEALEQSTAVIEWKGGRNIRLHPNGDAARQIARNRVVLAAYESTKKDESVS